MASSYTIRDGDTLDYIAKQLGVDAGQLAADNNISAGSALKTGTVLSVPQTQQNGKAQTGSVTAGVTPSQAATPYTGLSGLSQQTSQKLGEYSQGYKPSESVAAAQEYLNSILNSKPEAYQSQYQQNLDELYDRIMNREKFQYDLNGDMLYQQYKDQYQKLGRQAMMDTTAQAAAMTGGYGNSYAATAGNQAFQAYLQQLNEVVPELYQLALSRYQQEGQDLADRLSLTQSMEDQAYGRYRDTVSDWENERSFANSDYWAKYDADFSNYQTMLNYWNQIAQQENAQWNSDRDMAYSQAMALIQAGKLPSYDLLGMAGISEYDARQLLAAVRGGGGGSGSRSSSSGGTVTKDNTGENTGFVDTLQKLSKDASNAVVSMKNSESEGQKVANAIDALKKLKSKGMTTK